MNTKPIYLTKDGLVELQAELKRLRNVDRLELIERLQDATTGGDWTDSTERLLVEEELALVEARIRELQQMLAVAEIIPPDPDPFRVNVGDTVALENGDGQVERYTIVGSLETDPAAGLISNESPLGQALLGCHQGDEVSIQAPAGIMRFRIVALESMPDAPKPSANAGSG
ncbi:MAG TPA: transcription elongation factor GreA [Candidatus Binatia bacterium]|nr:transcription elongation factor GreA [Candidatus Binatia bacterium]